MPSPRVTQIAQNIRTTFAPQELSPMQAKLYSQRVRRDMGAPGLATFSVRERTDRLNEAMLLLEGAWVERRAGEKTRWRHAVKRAAEVLEWISHPSLRPDFAPLHLLSAAAYQVAGYPAMALGHLRRIPAEEPFSEILREFLRGDFDTALKAIHAFWAVQHSLPALDVESDSLSEGDPLPSALEVSTVRHVVMAIGAVCSYLRTGEAVLIERALAKLDALSQSYLHSRDPYSYLLARLVAEAARRFVDASLWPHVGKLASDANPDAHAALVQFARAAFANRRALVWPAQRQGIDRLAEQKSFVLCTPTGSGKTTIAVLAAVQGLFAPPSDLLAAGNLILYIVPSRALAAEVESRFAEDLQGIAAEPVVVTGLYGGADWGPTDAWVQIDQPTVVICTFEKADALVRYLGSLFLDRLRLVVIDEAHMVEQDPAYEASIANGTSRSLRLEQLSARLLRAQEQKGFRLIALSAVAARAAPALASWLGSDPAEGPITSAHRSTRQMLGRLEVTPSGRFDIRYDLMDGNSLEFEDERSDDRPYVPQPFPPLPGGVDKELGVEKRMQPPTFWAALHLAAERPDGTRPTVMISVTQNISSFAETCAELIDLWAVDEDLPAYWHVDAQDPHWIKCLAAAEDYFTKSSFEYRLLARGIAVHHGQMPALLSRRLKVAIDRGNVRIVIATSTLSEGVNIPVNTILIPSVHRATAPFTVNEFSNLIGRAGRPGVATEGNAFVVLPEREYQGRGKARTPTWNRTWNGYETLVAGLQEATSLAAEGDLPLSDGEANSPLAMLLTNLREAWEEVSGSDDEDEFIAWLEATAIAEGSEEEDESTVLLDTLDGLLIASVQEIEQLRGAGLSSAALETELLGVWRRTYAYVAAADEAIMVRTWLGRGRAITSLYPDPKQRRQIYKMSLAPRSGKVLLERAEAIRLALQAGEDYAERGPEAQLLFICGIVEALAEVPAFMISTKLGRGRKPFTEWQKLLRWWLFKTSLKRQPTPKEVGPWFAFVAENFIYRGNWGLGSLIGVLLDRGDDAGPVDALTMDDWPRSGLPWIAFWLKELVTWGTLDPVAAFLLARGAARDRPHAEADARAYYDQLDEALTANERLDPRRIRDWVDARAPKIVDAVVATDLSIPADLEGEEDEYLQRTLSVFPLYDGARVRWVDPAGYIVAQSHVPDGWPQEPSRFRFELAVQARTVTGTPYLPHRQRQ